ncbi:MAG TPA: GntR family transcriptional regulator [Chloroflexota bacterium]|nr:GntR family transcriptional regulator [Chloroflexota bacterium]
MKIDRRSFVPLYIQLRNIIQRQIMSGETPPGTALASEPALCRIHGVSRITVRQALGELESEGLIRREPGRGTFVAASTSKRGISIGLLYGGMSLRTFGVRNDTSFGDLVRGIAEVASRRNALLHPVPFSDEDPLEVALATPAVCQMNGLLVRLSRTFTEEPLQALDATGLPYVVIKRRLPDGRGNWAANDDEAGAAAMTGHLLDLGHRRIGLLLGPSEVGVWLDRERGYLKAHSAIGEVPDPQLTRRAGYPMDEGGYAATRELYTLAKPPTAIFAGNDYIAVGVYRALREMGLLPGRDVAVGGFGGTSFSTTMFPALSTVTIGGDALGRAAAELVLDIITGAVLPPARVDVPWKLEIRPSTVWNPAIDPPLALAASTELPLPAKPLHGNSS